MDANRMNCEAEHPEPRPATHSIHLPGSDSAANVSFACEGCVREAAEQYEQLGEPLLVLPYDPR